ncbi:hypothetical protein CCMA1212_005886 [Trichoderma ghanense]|uniref:Uncharacterized protein n=1 Tax=Trichoderma ghanense TaxID=65468 RepID=A0ABY2H1K4_9HYPO
MQSEGPSKLANSKSAGTALGEKDRGRDVPMAAVVNVHSNNLWSARCTEVKEGKIQGEVQGHLTNAARTKEARSRTGQAERPDDGAGVPEANTGGRGSSQDKDAGVARRSHDACTAEGIYSVVFRHRGQWVDSRGGNDGEELQQVHAARACRGALGTSTSAATRTSAAGGLACTRTCPRLSLGRLLFKPDLSYAAIERSVPSQVPLPKIAPSSFAAELPQVFALGAAGSAQAATYCLNSKDGNCPLAVPASKQQQTRRGLWSGSLDAWSWQEKAWHFCIIIIIVVVTSQAHDADAARIHQPVRHAATTNHHTHPPFFASTSLSPRFLTSPRTRRHRSPVLPPAAGDE